MILDAYGQEIETAIAHVGTRQDDWTSTLGGLGGSADRGRLSRVRFSDCLYLDDATLSAAYRDLWLVQRLVDMPVDDALRRGWGQEEGEELDVFEDLNYATHEEGAFERACKMARLKGGAGLYIGYKETAGPDALLQPAREGAEALFLEVFDRFQLNGTQRANAPTDVDRPDYDRPQVWEVIGNRRAGLRFHTSRMVKFPGVPRASDQFQTKLQDRDWGDSVLQASWADIVRYGVFWQTVGHLLQLASIGVLKLDGLIQLLASKNKDAAEARIDLLNQTISNTRLMMLDAGRNEDYKREAVSFADMPALLQEMAINTAGALGMPVTKLFRRAPAGMNATGESDIRMWYDDVEAYRNRVIVPRLDTILTIVERRDVELEFKPLWSMSEKECAEARNLELTGDETLWRMGVASEEEIRKARNVGDRPETVMTGAPPEPPEPPPAAPGAFNDPAVAPAPAPAAKTDGVDRDALIELLERFA
jgi:phage-related protein (TIGR01555 family)